MIDETCPVCEARRESVTREHRERMGALHESYATLVACLRREHEASVLRQAEWKRETFEIIERLHAKHAGDEHA